MRKAFDSAGAAEPLRCEIRALKPALDFSFRFQTGYRITVPLGQYRGAGHELQVIVRVIPEGREAVYLASTARLPEVPETNLDGEFGGRFVVGDGTYGVEVLVQDDQHRACQAKWHIEAKRGGSERDLKMVTAPGAVEELVSAGATPAQADRSGARIGRLTVLVHAAPLAPTRSVLDGADVDRLESALTSLLEQMPAQRVRVVLFNLEQRKVFWQKDAFAVADLEDVAGELKKLQLGTVDYKAMQSREEPAALMAHTLESELLAAMPPDAVIVLGPAARLRDPVPSRWAERPAFTARLFYLQYQPRQNPLATPFGMSSVNLPQTAEGGRGGRPTFDTGQPQTATPMGDTIDRLVQRWKGDTIVVRTPQEFADAIRRMASRIPKGSVAAIAPALPDGRGSDAVPVQAEAAPKLDTDEDPTEVLARLRDEVMAHRRRVPNYTCVQTVLRDRYEPVAGRTGRSCDGLVARRKQPGFSKTLRLESTDRLRLDVALADGGEIYSWRGASRFEERDLDEWIPEGAIGTGPFAASLLSVFEPRTATFTFEGERNTEGRWLLEYGFEVPKERSHYRVKAQREWIVTGYTGTLLVDPRSAELVRMTVRTEELPAATSTCETDTVLDYGMVRLDANDYLLPKMARQRFIGRDGGESENGVTFAACREYRGESSVRFGEGDGKQGTASRAEAAPLNLAAGLPVTIELTTPIHVDQAAAGDPVEGRLSEAVEGLPQGAKVEGRLMRVEMRYGSQTEVTVVLRWERVQVAGSMREWALAPTRRSAVPRPIRGVLQRRGTVIDLPEAGETHYMALHLSGEHSVVPSGQRTEWVTAKP
jgi:hypothetical protein